MVPFKVTAVKKSQAKGFAPVSVKLEAGPVQSSQFEGEPSRGLKKGKTICNTWGSDDRPTVNEPLTVASVQERTVQEVSFACPKEDEGRKDDKEFEWGRPLLGGSSDEEDYEEDSGSSFNRVSITLKGSKRRIVKPDQEIIEEYTDDTGRRVKRISKVTTTKAITRVERQAPSCMLAINVPAEVNENVEEYIDNHGRRVRRAIRSTVSESTNTVVRDGSVKFVLSPGKSGEEDFKEHSEDSERIQTLTTSHGYRVQQISKSTFKTQLKGAAESMTSRSPQRISAPEISQPPTGDTFDDDVFPVKVYRDISYPEWMELGKEDHPPSRNVSTSCIQIERYPTQSPRESAPEKPGVIEEVVPFTFEKRPLVIPREAFEVEEDSLAVRGRKRVEPPGAGLLELPVIPRKKVHKEIPSSLLSESDMPESESRGKVFELASPVYQQTGDEDVVPSVLTRQVVHPDWMIERRPSPTGEIPNVEGYFVVLASKPRQPGTKGDWRREPDTVSENVVATNLNREVVIPEITDMQGEKKMVTVKGGVTVKQYTSFVRSAPNGDGDKPETKILESAAPVYIEAQDEDVIPSTQAREIVLPEWMAESEQKPKFERKLHTASPFLLPTQAKRTDPLAFASEAIKENVTATTLNPEIIIPEIEDKRHKEPQNVTEHEHESGVRFSTVFHSEEEVVSTLKTRDVNLPKWMVEIPPSPEQEEKPDDGILCLVRPSELNQQEPEQVGNETILESVSATTLNRGFFIPEIVDTGDESPEEFVDENGVRVRRTLRRTTHIDGNNATKSMVQRRICYQGEPDTEFETDSEDVVPSVKSREIVLPEWMVVREPTPTEETPSDNISWLIVRSEPKEPQNQEQDTEKVHESVTASTLNREIVIPEFQDVGPRAEVEEYNDQSGVQVKSIVKRVITTTNVKRESPHSQPIEIRFPEAHSQFESPEKKEENLDGSGTVERTVTTRSVLSSSIDEQGEEIQIKVFESAAPVWVEGDSENIVPSRQFRDVVLPKWMVNSEPTQVEQMQPGEGITWVALPSEPQQLESREYDAEGISESVIATTLSREVVIPEIEDPEEATSRAEVVYLEDGLPQAVILDHGQPSSPRRGSIPFEASSIQRYLVIIETLHQYVMEHRSMIFIYSSQHMQFNFLLENFLHWILVTLKTLCWMVPVSGQLSEVQEQLQQIKVLMSHGMYLHVHDGCQPC